MTTTEQTAAERSRAADAAHTAACARVHELGAERDRLVREAVKTAIAAVDAEFYERPEWIEARAAQEAAGAEARDAYMALHESVT